MNEENPFAAPEVKLLSGTEEQEFDLEPQKRSFGEGRQWVSSAFDIFKSAPALWVGFTVVALGAQLMLSALPFGQLLIALFGMIMAAGGVWVSKKLHEGEEVQFGDFFIGFQLRTKELALAGFALFLGFLAVLFILVVVGLVVVEVANLSFETLMSNWSTHLFEVFGLTFVLLAMLLYIPVLMAGWFAPALIIFHDVPIIQAFKSSIKACMVNMLPFLFYGLLMTLLTIVVVITFGLGLLVWWPLVIISYYTCYQSVYCRD